MNLPSDHVIASRRFMFGVILLSLIKLWLIAPQEILVRSSPHDDTLFIGWALSMLEGEWLGPYNQFTLMKGPGYSLFIAFSNLIGLPLILSQELLYLGACLVFTIGLKHLRLRTRYLLIAFAVLIFNPFTYNFFPNVYPFRFGVYPAVSLLIFGLAQLILLRSQSGTRHGYLLLGFGLVLGWFWNIRGEAIWIAPSLAVFSVMYFMLRARACHTRPLRTALWRTIGAILISAVGFTIVNSSIAYQNFRTYGVYTTNEMKSPAFRAAYGGLLRIETVQWERFIPVNREARNIAYTVSPSFKRLEEYFEHGRGAQTWMKGGSDYIAAFFPWAFRDGIYSIGYFRDARSTHEFLTAIGAEIDSACDSGKIKCRPRYSELAPKWHTEWNGLAAEVFLDTLKRFVKFKGFVEFGPRPGSMNDEKLLTNYKYVTQSLVRPHRPELLESVPQYHKARIQSRNKLFGKILWLYRHLPQILFVIALAGLGWRVYKVFRGSRIYVSDAISISLIAGIFSYALILTILQVTSYTSIGRQLNTMYPIVLAFILSWVSGLAEGRPASADAD